MKVPFYVTQILINKEMNDIFQFPSVMYSNEMVNIFKRSYLRVPNNLKGTYNYKHEVGTAGTTTYDFSTIPYFIPTPCSSLINYIGSGRLVRKRQIQHHNHHNQVLVEGKN